MVSPGSSAQGCLRAQGGAGPQRTPRRYISWENPRIHHAWQMERIDLTTDATRAKSSIRLGRNHPCVHGIGRPSTAWGPNNAINDTKFCHTNRWEITRSVGNGSRYAPFNLGTTTHRTRRCTQQGTMKRHHPTPALCLKACFMRQGGEGYTPSSHVDEAALFCSVLCICYIHTCTMSYFTLTGSTVASLHELRCTYEKETWENHCGGIHLALLT